MMAPQFNLLLVFSSTLLVSMLVRADNEGIVLVNGNQQKPTTCAQLLGSNVENDEKLLLCQLYESSSLLTQLGALVSQGLDRLMVSQGVMPMPANMGPSEEGLEGQREKKKHEYLRFGKRKHEYLRFGKRKHEYLRFG